VVNDAAARFTGEALVDYVKEFNECREHAEGHPFHFVPNAA
jgi:hypothetical protein